MAKGRVASLYMLARVVPHAAGWSDQPTFYSDSSTKPSRVPLTGYATKKAAEAARKQLERRAREATPVGVFFFELLPGRMAELADAAARVGLPPPDYASVGLPPPDYASAGPRPAPPPQTGSYQTSSMAEYEYGRRVQAVAAAWWASVAPDVTPDANAKLWDALFPDFAFYVVGRVLWEE